MAYVKHDRTKTQAEALVGDNDTIYYTTDTHVIVMGGQIYSIQSEEIIEPITAKIDELVSVYNTQQETISLQLQTIIGDENN